MDKTSLSAADWKKFRDKHYPESEREFGERLWAGGFFDGEGHAGHTIPEDILAKGPRARLAIKQAYGDGGKANLVRFMQAVGNVGTITGPYKGSNPNHAPYHLWSVESEDGVDKVWTAIGPYLGQEKFEQFKMPLSVAGIREARSDALGLRKSVKRPNVLVTTAESKRQD